MTTFQIKKGLSANIAKATPIEGCWYVTTDTHRVYVCLDGKTIQPLEALSAETLKRLDDFETDINILKETVESLKTKTYDSVVTVDTFVQLPSIGKDNIVYIVVEENAMYRWASINGATHWYCVGRDYQEIKQICGGEASSFMVN